MTSCALTRSPAWAIRSFARHKSADWPPQEWWRYSLADWQQVKALYYGMVTLIDHNVGRILDALEANALAQDTIVLFVSDHGDHPGDHGLYGKGLPYDAALRVPLIWRGAGIAAGQQRHEVASTLDIAPTLLELAGVELPEGVQGHSMHAQLGGDLSPLRSAALSENDDDFVPMKIRVLTSARWKLVHYLNEPVGELYDRLNDPGRDAQPVGRTTTQCPARAADGATARRGHLQPGDAQRPATVAGAGSAALDCQLALNKPGRAIVCPAWRSVARLSR